MALPAGEWTTNKDGRHDCLFLQLLIGEMVRKAIMEQYGKEHPPHPLLPYNHGGISPLLSKNLLYKK